MIFVFALIVYVIFHINILIYNGQHFLELPALEHSHCEHLNLNLIICPHVILSKFTHL